MRSEERLILLLLLPLVLVAAGVVGYMAIERWSLVDALYMTIITLATVGFHEVQTLSLYGKLFTILLIISGVGIIAYAFSTITRLVVEGRIREVFGRRKMRHRVEKLKGHTIICGCGRIGYLVALEFQKQNMPLVVVEQDRERSEELMESQMLVLTGDATEETILLKAGIERAKALVTTGSHDAENVFIVLTARELNRDLHIVSRASDPRSEDKLRKAGADKVVLPDHIGGLRMALSVLQPAVVELIELATKSESLELQLGEIDVGRESSFIGKSLAESGIRKNLGIIVVAIQKPDGKMLYNPSPDTLIESDDQFIAMGESQGLVRLKEVVSGGYISGQQP